MVHVINVKMDIIKIKLKLLNVYNIQQVVIVNVKHGHKLIKINVMNVHLIVHYLIK